MRKLILFIVIGFSIGVSAQDTVFYNYNGYVAKSAAEAFFARILRRDPIEKERVLVRELSMAGEMLSEASYFPYSSKTLHGLSRKYYSNGLVKWEAFYQNGKLHGTVKAYWPEAKPKRSDVYRNDSLISSKCFAKSTADTAYFPFKTKLSFTGGMPGLFKYLDKTLLYPKDARKAKIQGEVLVSFMVDYDGNIKDVQIKKSLHPSLDKEALRVVQAMPKWQAATIDGDAIRSRSTLPIIFKLGEKR